MIVNIMNKEGKDLWAKMEKGAFLWFPNGVFWWLLMSVVLNFAPESWIEEEASYFSVSGFQ